MDTVILADPEVGGIDSGIERPLLVIASRLDDPDILQLLAALFRKLNALLGFLPAFPEVIAVLHERTEEIPVLGSEHARTTALIEHSIENATALQTGCLNLPVLAVSRGEEI